MARWGLDSARGVLPRWSLRVRLTLWMVAIFALIQWVTGGVFWLYRRPTMERLLDAALFSEAQAIAMDVGDSALLPFIPTESLQFIAAKHLREDLYAGFAVAIFDEGGVSSVLGGEDFPPAGLPPARRGDLEVGRFFSLPVSVLVGADPDSSEARAVVVPIPDRLGRGYHLVVAAGDATVRRELGTLGRVLLLAGTVGPIAAGVAGWFIAGVAVGPLERLRRLAQGLGPGSQSEPMAFTTSNVEVARLAQDLEDARERIQGAFAAQERFLSNVSHEIKTPIAVMLVEAETLNTSGMSQEVRSFVKSTREEMARLGSLVESFLTLSRVQDGKGEVRGRPYSANDLVMDSVDHCLMMANQHGVRLAPALLDGEGGMEVTVLGDPELLCTMVENLVRNAIRFSPEEGRVEVSLSREAGSVLVRVGDEGPGIPPERLERIFDRFEQGGSEQRTGRGHGLGLAIARGIAELHGGTIVAANREPRGCVFEVRLPVVGERE